MCAGRFVCYKNVSGGLEIKCLKNEWNATMDLF